MTAIAPQNLTYDNRNPYITPAELKGSAIAAAVDLTNLVPNGNQAAQDRALADLIAQASAYADTYTLGAVGTLCATVNTETARLRQNRSGFWICHPAFWPILEVRSFAVGLVPGQLDSLPVDNQTCFIEQREFTIATGGLTTSSAGPIAFGASGRPWQRPYFVQYEYVNGFFNQTLAAQASAGSSSLSLPDTTGLYPGSQFTIYDAALTEAVEVDASWDGTSTTVPLTTATKWAHGKGTNASTLPPTVKQAVIHIVVSMVKQRGEGGLVLDEVGQPTAVTGSVQTSAGDLERAHDLLNAFVQIWGRS